MPNRDRQCRFWGAKLDKMSKATILRNSANRLSPTDPDIKPTPIADLLSQPTSYSLEQDQASQ